MRPPDGSAGRGRALSARGDCSRASGGASRSRPNSARRAAAAELALVTTLNGATEQPVTGIVVSEDGSGLVTAGLDGQLTLWTLALDEQTSLGTTMRSAQGWRRTLTQPVGGGEINAIALLGSVVACGCQDGSVRLFRLFKEAASFVLYSLLRKQHTSTAAPAAPAAAGTASAFAAATGSANEFAAPAAAPPSEVMCVALSSSVLASRNAPLLASGAQDGSVCLWDSSSGRLMHRLQAHEHDGTGWVMALVLSRHADGRSGLMLTASYDHTVRVWSQTADDIGGGGSSFGGGSFCSPSAGGPGGPGGPGGGPGWVLERTLEGHTDGVLGLELSRTRRHAFSASNDHSVRVWELASGACLQVLEQHGCSVSALGWHLASGCLATGAEDGTVHLWDVAAFDEAASQPPSASEKKPAEIVQTLNIEHCEVLCLVPSADGTALFCGLDDGSLAVLGGK